MRWLFFAVLVLFVRTEHIQLLGNETVETYWPGDSDMTNHDLCSVAITKTTVVRIQGFGTASRKQFEQALPPSTVAAGILYNKPTTSLWLGVADTTGTITWMFANYDECQNDFHTEWDYPVMSYPGVTWDRAFTQIDKNNYQKTVVTFVGDTLLVQFGFNEVGQPSVLRQYALPWNFGSAQRTVVGFGEGLPWGTSNTPSLVVARQINDGLESTGELVLLDQTNNTNYQQRYFPNLRGWQSHYTASSVSGFALIDPFSSTTIVNPVTGKLISASTSSLDNTAWIVGFVPGSSQPLTIPFLLPPNKRWSSGVSWTRVDEVKAIGVVLVGNVEPGGPLDLRFILLNNETFVLLPTKVSVNETNTVLSWIPQSLSFMSAPERDNEPQPAIYFAAQNAKGPIIYEIPFPNVSELLADQLTLETSKQVDIVSEAVNDILYDNLLGKEAKKRSVLCNVKSKCVLLSPKDNCQMECCQTYLSSLDHKFLACCCKDCNLGNCVGDPGTCIH